MTLIFDLIGFSPSESLVCASNSKPKIFRKFWWTKLSTQTIPLHKNKCDYFEKNKSIVEELLKEKDVHFKSESFVSRIVNHLLYFERVNSTRLRKGSLKLHLVENVEDWEFKVLIGFPLSEQLFVSGRIISIWHKFRVTITIKKIYARLRIACFFCSISI